MTQTNFTHQAIICCFCSYWQPMCMVITKTITSADSNRMITIDNGLPCHVYYRSFKSNILQCSNLLGILAYLDSLYLHRTIRLSCSSCYKTFFGGNLDFPKINKLNKVCSDDLTCTKMLKQCNSNVKL